MEEWTYYVNHRMIIPNDGGTPFPGLGESKMHEYVLPAGMSRASLRKAIINRHMDSIPHLNSELDIGMTSVFIVPKTPGFYTVISNQYGGMLRRDDEIFYLHGHGVKNIRSGNFSVSVKERSLDEFFTEQ